MDNIQLGMAGIYSGLMVPVSSIVQVTDCTYIVRSVVATYVWILIQK